MNIFDISVGGKQNVLGEEQNSKTFGVFTNDELRSKVTTRGIIYGFFFSWIIGVSHVDNSLNYVLV